jgi:hypothetical protein
MVVCYSAEVYNAKTKLEIAFVQERDPALLGDDLGGGGEAELVDGHPGLGVGVEGI